MPFGFLLMVSLVMLCPIVTTVYQLSTDIIV